MQVSQYLKAYPCQESPGRVLLFSTRTVSKILIRKETYQVMEEGGTLAPSDESLLSRLGILVRNREEERGAVLSLFDKIDATHPGLNVMVVLNLDCNFACTYCYEGGMKGKHYMSEETADRLIDFIKGNFPERKKSLLIDFYGGEPLLSVGLIKRISGALKAFTETRGAAYGFTLVTNGSLFTRRTAEELAPFGLKGVKITLDGPAEVHDRCRPFKSGRGSFDAIVANIKETCDLVKIGIGGNFQRDNHEQFPSLLDYLTGEGLTPGKIALVKFDPVMKPPQGNLSPPECTGGCTSINDPWLSDAALRLREEILKRGYHTHKLQPITCMIETTNAYVVNYDGAVYKCPGLIGKTGYEAGDVRTGLRQSHASVYKPGIWRVDDDCSRCAYLPLCFGGCRYMKFVRDGNMDGVECQKAYLDAALETLVKQDVKYRSKADTC